MGSVETNGSRTYTSRSIPYADSFPPVRPNHFNSQQGLGASLEQVSHLVSFSIEECMLIVTTTALP
jgi:hypothetical protein